MNTNEQQTNMTIGRLIREKREEKNLSLKVISHQTKIHLGLLELLEKDELLKLPSKIYVRGFVKSTAKVLDIELKMALSLLEEGYQENAPTKKLNPTDVYLPSNSQGYFNSLKNNALTSSSLVAKIFLGLIFIAILGINIKSYLDRPSEDTQPKLPTVLTTVHHKTKSVPKPVVENVPTALKEKIKSSPPIMPVNIIQDSKLAPAPTPAKIVPVKTTIIELPPEEQKTIIEKYLPAKFQILPPKGQEFVFLNAADGDSWVTYKVDKAEIKKYVLRQGRTLFLHGSNIRLFLGNTKTIKMFHNKSLITFKEKSGPVNLVFPESLKSQYTEPLFIFQTDGSVVTTVP